MPPEKIAYALARYSRSPDSIRDSIDWVRGHDSQKFLESFYFQYGHASIADLGHLTICFEGISELAATEIEDEQLWDGQARSSRYQDFSLSGVIVPPELTVEETSVFQHCADHLLIAYRRVKERVEAHLNSVHPCPEQMKPETYRRNLAARAFDVARYLLPLGITTGVGQVTSIRTLEKQIKRFRASEFQELRELGEELTLACRVAPSCPWNLNADLSEPIAPTLARHCEPDSYARRLKTDLREWVLNRHPDLTTHHPDTDRPSVDLLQPSNTIADICATLLYPVTTWSYRDLYILACSWPEGQRSEVINLALGSRTKREELPRHFRSAPYVLDLTVDIGAYRDLHRHRRCQQFRQQYTEKLGYETPALVEDAGASSDYSEALRFVSESVGQLPEPAAQYLLPFAARSRFLFKLDFAELEYISRLRSGVKGHFSYRKIAWEMKKAMERLDPDLGSLIEATPPWIEDPLTR